MASDPSYGAASHPVARPLINLPQLGVFANQAARYGLAVVLLLPAIASAWLGHYSRFTDDAYCQANTQQTYGALGMVVRLYQVWSGRFAGGFFDGLEAGT